MKKIALVFVIAVFVPSLVLAWLAVRSLRDQQLILERQQTLLYQGVADALAKEADELFTARQREFGQQVEKLISNRKPSEIVGTFDDRLRANWPVAEVGFVVTVSGDLLCPTTLSRPATKTFYAENGKFVCNVQPAEVYWNYSKAAIGNQKQVALNAPAAAQELSDNLDANTANSSYAYKGQPKMRNVVPQQQSAVVQGDSSLQSYSKVASSEADFKELVGDSMEGSVARFLENKLNVLVWYRSRTDTHLIFGAQLSVPRLKEGLKPVTQELDTALRGDIAVALLDDSAKPVAVSRPDFKANWKHPFVATEIGEALPHWEMAVYLIDPAKLAASVRVLKCTLGILIAFLLIAIGVGGSLIVVDLRRQLTLARQKTDFVSNVSHELKTPLTSIRMFSELLAEGLVSEPVKRQTYLNIITSETSRLTRLINNVLDFSRLERGEKKYNLQPCDLVGLVRETVETYRPHLESNGFTLHCDWPDSEIMLHGDRDALAQVVVNLLSNAEKYSNGQKEITVHVGQLREPLPHAEVRVMDRGSGVPPGCEEKIFEQFYRAHDSLSSGIQGSGLGLTLARRIARAHAGDVVYRPREGGGSCFILRLPLQSDQKKLL